MGSRLQPHFDGKGVPWKAQLSGIGPVGSLCVEVRRVEQADFQAPVASDLEDLPLTFSEPQLLYVWR